MLLKFKYFVKFLQQHCPEVFPEVRQAYVETLSRIYRSALCASSAFACSATTLWVGVLVVVL